MEFRMKFYVQLNMLQLQQEYGHFHLFRDSIFCLWITSLTCAVVTYYKNLSEYPFIIFFIEIRI
jgi:hypothetical protein